MKWLFAPSLAAAGEGAGSLFETMLFMVLIIGVMWFLLIRPQRKRDRERREMLERLKKGDRVVTVGGIHGEVAAVRENEVILCVDPEKDVTIKFSRSSISRILGEGESDEEEGKS